MASWHECLREYRRFSRKMKKKESGPDIKRAKKNRIKRKRQEEKAMGQHKATPEETRLESLRFSAQGQIDAIFKAGGREALWNSTFLEGLKNSVDSFNVEEEKQESARRQREAEENAIMSGSMSPVLDDDLDIGDETESNSGNGSCDESDQEPKNNQALNLLMSLLDPQSAKKKQKREQEQKVKREQEQKAAEELRKRQQRKNPQDVASLLISALTQASNGGAEPSREDSEVLLFDNVFSLCVQL